MAFARPSNAAGLDFLCIKLPSTDLEQTVHEDQTKSHTAHKPTRTYKDWQNTWTRTPRQKVPQELKSSSRQPQNQVPRTCHKQTCYDPQLQGCLIWQCHLSDPFGSYIIGSSLYLSSSYLQKRSRQVQNVARPFQKQSSETVDKLNCKTMTTVKTVADRVQWVHMCPTACKWHQTRYQVKTVDIKSQNSEMNITWTEDSKLCQLA